MSALKSIGTLALLMAISAMLVACPNPEPSDSSADTDGPSQPGSDASSSSTTSTPSSEAQTSSEDAESAPSGTLAVEREKLIGRWQTAGGSADTPGYVYAFAQDGSLTVTSDGSVVLDGRWELTVDQAVRLLVRDPDSGELQPEMTLRLMVRRGEAEYVFEVAPSGNTLWLRKMTDSSEASSD